MIEVQISFSFLRKLACFGVVWIYSVAELDQAVLSDILSVLVLCYPLCLSPFLFFNIESIF